MAGEIKLDEFTTRVIPDPNSPPDVLLLAGFLGASSQPGQTRVYWDASLSSYVDVDTADIVNTEPLPKEQSPLGGSYIWVKRSAQVSVGSAAGRSAKGKFFEGPLMTAFGGAFGTAAGAAFTTPVVTARPTILFCTELCPPVTRVWVCTMQGHLCQVSQDVVGGCPPVPGAAVQAQAAVIPVTIPAGFCSAGFPCTLAGACHTHLPPCTVAPQCHTLPTPCPTHLLPCAPAGAAAAAEAQVAGVGALPISVANLCNVSFACTHIVLCQPSILIQACPTHNPILCFPTLLCLVATAAACPVVTPGCPVASPGCPPVGPGTPVQGQAGFAAAAAVAPGIAGSYAPGCWHSWNACPTDVGCGPHHTPGCPQFQAGVAAGAAPQAGIPSLVCSYGPGCWYSWNACPSQYGCGPHHTPGCPQFQAAACWGGTVVAHPSHYCQPSQGSCGHMCTM
jgi:hypothetical protein